MTSSNVYLIAAKRSAVLPRHGAFQHLQAHEIAAPVIKQLLVESKIHPDQIDTIVMGNALYGGGNPARLAALLAGIPQQIPALTIDSQCCGGLDSLAVAATYIQSGQARLVLAGGLESYSRSPRRFKRAGPCTKQDEEYLRPPFSPFPDCDPDMIEAAATLAKEYNIPRSRQEAFAIRSHAKAITAQHEMQVEIVPIEMQSADSFNRKLTEKTCARLPLLAGSQETGLTAATVAVEADAAALILLASEDYLQENPHLQKNAILFRQAVSVGGSPTMPALAPIHATEKLLSQILSARISVVEIMEAFAVQAMAYMDHFQFDPAIVNRGGGGLSRGHPIGASGTINIVRLWHELQKEDSGALGIASIAAAGGLGSSLLLEKR